MGICLDTEANSTAPDTEDAEWKGGGGRSSIHTPSSANMPLENTGKVKFDPPSVPVIFVLGGPGSGKVTHCDTLMEEKRGVTHINMMDLLHQHVISNDMQDFSQLSSRVVTEVLMLEMKMAPAAKAYLISGFPRSMRDVVEYSDKIQVVSGVILISWRQAVLQKQIDYGAKLGHVVLSLAKMELDNFFKNVIPVADYFDQSGMLRSVNGERNPAEVYKDFREAVFEVLGAEDNQNALLNGIVGMGRGVNEIPGTIVTVETAPSQKKDVITVRSPSPQPATSSAYRGNSKTETILDPHYLMGQQTGENPTQANLSSLPPVIWVIGGPGSNKSTLCLKAVALNPGWGHISIGRIVRTISESEPKANTENHKIKAAIVAGEMVAKQSIDKLLESHMMLLKDKKGIIIDGYPREVNQVKDFEEKYQQMPPIILLDCSKLQLGRGRLDDTVSSFRRRLELFRELTLPMLKVLDSEGRLSIVDGDTDNVPVQREFERVIRQQIIRLNSTQQLPYQSVLTQNPNTVTSPLQAATKANRRESLLQDLDNVPGTVPTISNHISVMHENEHKANNNYDSNKVNNVNNSKYNNYNNVNNNQNIADANGDILAANVNGRKSFRSMLEDAENYPIDS